MANSGQRCRWLCVGGADGGCSAAVFYRAVDMEFAYMKIIEMAREVGAMRVVDAVQGVSVCITQDQLERLAALVRADEREACANDWETLHGYDKHGVAEAIRARENT